MGHGIEASKSWQDTYAAYPEWMAQLPDFLPGQHITLRAQIAGQDAPVVRCYSLVGAAVDPERECYQITVRHVPEVFSTFDDLSFELAKMDLSHYQQSAIGQRMLRS